MFGKFFPYLLWGLLILAAFVAVIYKQKMVRNLRENGIVTDATVSDYVEEWDDDSVTRYNNVIFRDDYGNEHKALLQSSHLYDEGEKIRIKYVPGKELNVLDITERT